MSSAQTFRELSIDAGSTWNADYLRGCDVAISMDGTSWTKIASGAGTSQVVVIDFASTSARYVRLTLNSGATSTTHWWSIAEFNVKN
jgi:glucosylceramidase